MSRFIYTLLILFSAQLTFAQKEIIIKGKIFDAETGAAIPEVHVFIKGSTSGSITDKNGSYMIIFDNIKDTIVYSHIQYKTYETNYHASNINADILLEPMVSILPDAIIKPIVNISKGMMFDVTDYFFIGDDILYSGYCYHYKRNNNPWLILKSASGDTIFSQCVKIEGTFFKDCFGNIHYMTEKTVFQLVFDNDSIWFDHPTKTDEFKSAMNGCHMEINDKVLLSQYYNNNQVLIYYIVDKETIEAEVFRTIADESKLNMLAFSGIFFSMGQSPSDADLRFEQMMYNPVFAPIIKIKDSLFIINYTDSKIEKFDTSFNSQGNIDINFHNARFCKDEIIIDEKTGRVYSVFKNKGKFSVKEIFLNDGNLGPEINIPDFYWIDNVKVHNNNLYFLYREKYSTKLNALYKMNLE